MSTDCNGLANTRKAAVMGGKELFRPFSSGHLRRGGRHHELMAALSWNWNFAGLAVPKAVQ